MFPDDDFVAVSAGVMVFEVVEDCVGLVALGDTDDDFAVGDAVAPEKVLVEECEVVDVGAGEMVEDWVLEADDDVVSEGVAVDAGVTVCDPVADGDG